MSQEILLFDKEEDSSGGERDMTGRCSVATAYSEQITNGEDKCGDLFDSDETEGIINLRDVSFQINEDRADSDSDDVIIIE